MKPTLLFDLDGTLTDSRPGIVNCIEHALERLGVACSEDLSFCLGPPLHKSFARLLKTDDPAAIDEAIRLYRERFGAVGMFENEVYPGIESLLEELKAKGHRLFVATSKPHFYARPILAHFEMNHHFEVIYGSELGGERSDKKLLVAHIMESEGLDPKRTVMIGDREHDVIGARANGLTSVGVLWGYGSAEELRASGVHQLVETPSQLIQYIDTL